MDDHIDDHVSAFIDNELLAADRLKVEGHLQNCERCSQLVEEVVSLQSEVTAFFQSVAIPEDLRNKVLREIKSKSSAKSWMFRFGIVFVPIVTAILIYGSLAFKLVSIFFKMAVGVVYAAFHFMGSQPAALMSFVIFAILLLVISAYSLQRLLRTNLSEGDESFG